MIAVSNFDTFSHPLYTSFFLLAIVLGSVYTSASLQSSNEEVRGFERHFQKAVETLLLDTNSVFGVKFVVSAYTEGKEGSKVFRVVYGWKGIEM